MKDSNVKWVVSLSNGETIYEGKGDYKKIEGERSPYQRLLCHIEEENLKITSLGLFNDKNKRWNLPSAGKNPNFRSFDQAEKPISYKFRRKMAADILDGKAVGHEEYAMIEAEFEDYKLQIWVSDEEPHPSWSLVV